MSSPLAASSLRENAPARETKAGLAALAKVRRGKVRQVGQMPCHTTTPYRGVG